ncbi:hypothetical protein BU26DRAFT_564215 [Trematosphaeria pertusa]|uniref:Uncharacterized protein n=1 Tax=Trematosphaeria pertusa TaxID=390896 RepID=A0A6A6IJG3_9PLEO|nr:uncharacterized protein BU26DRAFT_564215 [Trematosphaeria pertusa]KAF2250359.1 hypothetical protein BU26DRAFT_564215 [Trematosphaeria pertusa]
MSRLYNSAERLISEAGPASDSPDTEMGRVEELAYIRVTGAAEHDSTHGTDRSFEAWRLAFCEAFTARMPRELRDMTYDHLLEPEYIVRVDPGESLRWCLPDLQCASKIIPAIDPVTESLFLPENVGQEFAFEMAQQLYQRGSFDVLDPRGLDMVFDNDLFSVHKKPCGYPRGLRIHMWENLQGGVWLKNMRNEQETLQEALVWRVLDKGLKTAQVIELVLHFCDVQMCKSLLKNIAPLVYGLRAEGTCVSVVRRVFLGHNLRTAAYGSPEYDMTWLFNQTMQGCLTTINEARVHAHLGKRMHREAPQDGFVRRLAGAVVPH